MLLRWFRMANVKSSESCFWQTNNPEKKAETLEFHNLFLLFECFKKATQPLF